MIIAITGGRGFIGKILVDRLLAGGHMLRLLSRKQYHSNNSVNIEYIQGDINDVASLNKLLHGADAVCNCAGEIVNEQWMYSVNVDGVKNLYQHALKNGVRKFVHLSSVGVYGFHNKGAVDESFPLSAENRYEETKIIADQWLLDHLNHNMDVSILRPSIVFSEDMKNNSLRQLVSVIKSGKFFYVGGRTAIANYVCVDNVVAAIKLLLEVNDNNKSTIYNISDSMSLKDFVEEICAVLNITTPQLRLPKLPVYILAFFLDMLTKLTGVKFPLTRSRVDALSLSALYTSDKLKNELGYEPCISIHEGLKKAIQTWYS